MAPLVVLVYDLFLCAVMVVGQYGSVHIFHAGQEPFWEIAAFVLVGTQRVTFLSGNKLVVKVDINALAFFEKTEQYCHVKQQ